MNGSACYLADEEATKASVERALGSLRALVKQERAGSVRVDGTVTPVVMEGAVS